MCKRNFYKYVIVCINNLQLLQKLKLAKNKDKRTHGDGWLGLQLTADVRTGTKCTFTPYLRCGLATPRDSALRLNASGTKEP